MYARIVIIKGYKNELNYAVEVTENNGESWTTVAVTTKRECCKIKEELRLDGYLTWDGVPW